MSFLRIHIICGEISLTFGAKDVFVHMWPKESFLVFVTSNLSLSYIRSVMACSPVFSPSPVEAYHRNQKVGRLGVTSHVHGNDLRKHILCRQILYHGSSGRAPWPLFSTFKSSRFLLSVYYAGFVLGNSTEEPNPTVRVFHDALE